MSLITVSHLEKAYGAQDVFQDISFTIPPGARIALVGSNGVGKTTLLRILIGSEQPDGGEVARARSLSIGYLPQEVMFSHTRKGDLDRSIWDSCLDALADLRRQEEEVAALETAMASGDPSEELIRRYGEMQEIFERAGGYTYPARIKQVLHGLGFKDEIFQRPLRQLSGGERTRALLARLLLEEPDLLVLDEPTNHLDIGAVEWLEAWLKDWAGAYLIVSHDRYFLDCTAKVILELGPTGIDRYRGNYSAYVHQREERRARREVDYQAQQAFVRKEKDFIQRNIAGQNTRQAQGRRKRLERLLRDEAVDQPIHQRSLSIDFGEADRSGDKVLETRDLVIGYADSDAPLFSAPDLLLLRGECIALIGPNGAGKTTFVKNILGVLNPRAGMVQLGASLKIGYFAQAHEDLNPGHTLFEEIHDQRPSWKNEDVRSFLAQFLFSGDDLEKPIALLSGGERGRIALAKLVLSGANFLLLDEPTNHLDLVSQEMLQAALQQYEGTILLVSHDRYLINALATQVWVIVPDEKALQVYRGGFQTYLEARRRASGNGREDVPDKRNSGKNPAARTRRASPAELARMEDRIDSLEQQLAELVVQMEANSGDAAKLQALSVSYSELQDKLNIEISHWSREAMDGERA